MPPPNTCSDDDEDMDGVEDFHDQFSDDTMVVSSTTDKASDLGYPDCCEKDEVDGTSSGNDFDIDDTIEDDGYSLQKLVEEAKSYYGHKKPDFCINKPQMDIKKIRLNGGDGTADIHFHDWSNRLGYWVLTDNISDSYIIKCFGSKYHCWEGVDKGFSQDHIATISKAGQQATGSSGPNKSFKLRERKTRQLKPYTMYKAGKKYDQKGLRLSETELEEVISNTCSSPAVPKSYTSPKICIRKKALTPRSSPDSHVDRVFPGTPSSTVLSDVSDEEIRSKTVIRTRFEGFDRATIPITARKCSSNEMFFQAIKEKWEFKLLGRRIAYCVAHFPWLDPNKNILLQEHDEESFSSVIDEVRRAPNLMTGNRTEVVVELCIEGSL